MAVEDSEAPGGHDEDASPGKEDPHEHDRECASIPSKPWGDELDDERGGEDADQDEHGDRETEDRGHGAGDALRLLSLPAGE